MMIITSIDIQNGNCVRLTQGDFGKVVRYPTDPRDIASKFCDSGASALHIVDLDGARSGVIAQTNCIQSIRGAFGKIIQVGGGIRTEREIESLLNLGIDRVVIGSSAVLDVEKTVSWIDQYGADVIVLALDFCVNNDMPLLAIKGWQEKTNCSLWDVLQLYPNLKHLLCTDISKDGMKTGPNFQFYQEIKERFPGISVQASGGVSSLQDVLKLKSLRVDGAVIGKALYEGQLDLKEAISCSRLG